MQTAIAQRPMNTWARSLVCGRKRSTKSRTNRVETEFIVASNEEINAQTSAANTNPRTPLGSSLFISMTKVVLGSFESGIQRQRDHARQGENENRRQFQQHAEHRAPAGLLEVRRAQARAAR